MSFDVAADAYDRFMGRYSVALAPAFADFAGIEAGQHVLDVGCGPGALTGELVRRVGSAAVAAVDPAEAFVATARERHPGADVRIASAEQLPFPDASFDAALAQLVVHFTREPVTALAEMARVTREGGVVAACVWDFAGGRSPLSTFWETAAELDVDAPGESCLPGARAGHLVELLAAAGLQDVEEASLATSVEHADFDEWWTPFTFGVGPAGTYVRGLDEAAVAALRERCRAVLPDGPFHVEGVAFAARGRA